MSLTRKQAKQMPDSTTPILKTALSITLKLLICAISLTFSVTGGLWILKQYEHFAGADIKSNYLCEPRPRMWQPDPDIGFRNKSNLCLRSFGNIVGSTDHMGFRLNHDDQPGKQPNGVRIIGLGDSVMWGTRVNSEQSFLGILEARGRKKNRKLDIYNTGVSGYSTYQEYLFLKKYILPLDPDIILVNYCYNDWMPTEDPYQRSSGVYSNYVSNLLNNPDYHFKNRERELMGEFVEDVWGTFRRSLSHPTDRALLRRFLIEIPILEMSRLSRENNFRLIYLFIPNTVPASDFLRTKHQLQEMLRNNMIEYMDFTDALLEDRGVYSQKGDFKNTTAYKILQNRIIQTILSFNLIKTIEPETLLENLGKVKNLNNIHSHRNYIDRIGHPSEKGNRIIGNAIYNYLYEQEITEE